MRRQTRAAKHALGKPGEDEGTDLIAQERTIMFCTAPCLLF